MNFLRTMLSNSQAASFGRAGACVIVIVWLVLCAWLTTKLGTSVDIPVQWAALAGALFGATKLPDVVAAFKTKKEVPDVAPDYD